MNRFYLFSLVAVFSFLLSMPIFADAESSAKILVEKEVQAILAGKSEFARKIGKSSDFYRELLKVMRRFSEVGMPKPLKFNGKTAKILVPMNLDAGRVGGFFQTSADGKRLISYLPWNGSFEPLFIVDRQKWEQVTDASQIESLKELVPLTEGYSAGTPVDPADLTDL